MLSILNIVYFAMLICGSVGCTLHVVKLVLYFIDNDECEINNGECWHDCTNNIGSYVCSCIDGYLVDTSDISACVGMYW